MMELTELQRKSLIRIVDDDPQVRESLSFLLKVKGWSVVVYDNAEAFLEGERFDIPGCVILDIRMASMSGLELQIYLERNLAKIPIIFITAHGEVDSAVHTMKHGAVDFLQKPIDEIRLDKAIFSAVSKDLDYWKKKKDSRRIKTNYDSLTPREREVIELVAQELTNREISERLGISERTVHTYRSVAMDKLEVKTVLQLVNALEMIKN